MRFICLILLYGVLGIHNVCGQNVQWLQSYGQTLSWDGVVRVAAKPNGNIVFGINGFATDAKDTVTLGNDKYYSNKKVIGRSFFVEQTPNGKIQKTIMVYEGLMSDFCQDANGNFYVSATLDKANSHFIGNKLLSRSDGDFVLIKYDKNFNLKWVRQYGDSGNCRGNQIYCSQGQLFISAQILGMGVDFDGQVFNSPISSFIGVDIFASIDTANGDVVWGKYSSLLSYGIHHIKIADILKMSNGKVFICGANYGPNDIIIQSDTLFKYSAFVMRLNQAGNYERMICFKNRFSTKNIVSYKFDLNNVISSITTNGKSLFISGTFRDSAYWNSDTVVIDPGSISSPFVASLSLGLKEGWFYKPTKTSKESVNYQDWTSITQYNGFLYLISHMNTNVRVDSANFTLPKGANWSMMIQKLDVLGNSLWAMMDGRDAYSNYLVATKDGVFIGGGYLDSLTLSPFKVKSSGNYDAFITRISDNTITRGPVSSGPYCAGDTFNIPYTKDGNFDSLNYFIAELSDENGNFDKQIRRLGVLRTNKDSVIRGVLPLFQVQSSPNYRIRIRSTRPAVQSFYKLDTLKLLVYSRDKAYAGKDTAICPGDSISLRTYGGTKWEWSPKQNMQDSTKSSTKVWPTKTTKYRIVISDSSGCGQADTAYKTIILRYPKATLSTTDTTVCKGDTLNLKATFTGGDSTNYNWRWQSKETGGWVNQSAGQNLQTVNWNYAYKQDTAITLRLLLSDGCQRPQDTTEIKVGPKSHLKFTVPTLDTILCAGVPFTAKAKGQGGDAANYQFRWALMPNNTLLSGTDSIRWVPTQNSQLRITLADGCMEKADTQFVNIKVRSTLNAISNLNDSILCYGQNITFSSTGEGGDTTNYQYRWLLDGKTIGNGNTVSIATEAQFNDTGGLKTLKLVLADNCTAKNDTISAEIRVRPKLQVQMQYDSVFCFGEINTLKANGKGGTGIYRFTWYDPSGKQVSTTDSISIKHSDKAITGQKRYLAILSDGCSAPQDSQIATLKFLSPLAVSISSLDSCLRLGSTLTAFASGGDGNYTYTWFESQIEKGTSKSLNIPLPSTEIQYTLIAKDGCSADSAVASKAVSPYPQIRISSDKDSGCEKLRVQLKAIKQNQTTNEYRYTVGGTRTSWSSDSNYIANFVAGKYMPILEVKTMLGCTDTLQFKSITVHPKPTAAYSYTPARPVPSSPEIALKNLSNGAEKYEWDFGKYGKSSDKDPLIKIGESGTHEILLVSISERGCRDTIAGTVKVYEDYIIWLPNAFTPNGDNLNELFEPMMQGVEKYEMHIYNRWGEQIYRGANKGWDGMQDGKPVPEGMYVYYIKITTVKYDYVQEKGTLMVLKPE